MRKIVLVIILISIVVAFVAWGTAGRQINAQQLASGYQVSIPTDQVIVKFAESVQVSSLTTSEQEKPSPDHPALHRHA